MSQRHSVSGRRSAVIWLSVLIGLALITALVVLVLFVYPNYQRRQQVEQHYQAGVAFQEAGDWGKAAQAFEQVIAIDATYRDARSRLAEVKAKQQETDATAQAEAARATTTARAWAAATAATATTEAEIVQATSVAATATAQTRSTAEAQQANATATAETVAQLEATYQKCLGSINLERWEDARTACDQVFSIEPNYKDVQTKLTEIEMKLAELRVLTPTSTLPTYTPYPTATPYATYTAVPTPRPTVTPWKELDKAAIPTTYYYGFNTTKAPFDDPLVRRAFSCAIDRQAIVDDILDGRWQPATTFVHPKTLGRYLYGEVGCTYDPNEARELLTQAGHPNGEGLPHIVLMYNTHEVHKEIAEAIQKMWLAVLGVNVRLESMEWEAYLERLAEDVPQVYRSGWAADYNDPINFLNIFRSGDTHNYTKFSSPEYDELVKGAAVETEKAMRIQLFVEAERILCETEAVIAPIYHYTVEE